MPAHINNKRSFREYSILCRFSPVIDSRNQSLLLMFSTHPNNAFPASSTLDPFAPPARKLVDFGLAQFSCDVCGEWFTPVSQVVFSPLRYRFIDYVQALLQLILSILSKCYTGPRLHDFCWQSQPKMPSNGRTKLSRSYCRTLYIFCRDDEVAPESTSATAKPRRLFEAGDGVNVFAEPAVMNR